MGCGRTGVSSHWTKPLKMTPKPPMNNRDPPVGSTPKGRGFTTGAWPAEAPPPPLMQRGCQILQFYPQN
ncbi:hypothetical protein AV530_013621 [Patagioenas fasciata monilis]|uniref:Uncharacterized protein n=1 Tax=Patagioenas fasciata monilis TaxID=372326 RepID=A0A1V4KN16_PATFA|nr:hypothetical protein AV530_013621 [Patagioenas fasciata monilis]